MKPFAFDRFQFALEKFAAQKMALSETTQFDQQNIDSVIDNYPQKIKYDYPKGIQPKTLEILKDYLSKIPGAYFPSEVIAEKTGLSIVTVRRYMSYLEEIGCVKSQLNYETGGRPCVLYKIKTK